MIIFGVIALSFNLKYPVSFKNVLIFPCMPIFPSNFPEEMSESKTGQLLNPLVRNGFSHSYHLDESTFFFRDIRGIFHFYFSFRSTLCKQTD